jgi:hypothetical protein
MPEFFQNRQVCDRFANGDADARFLISRLKDAEWKILQWKMRIRWHFNETAQWRTHHRDLTTKHTKATKKFRITSKDLRALRGY